MAKFRFAFGKTSTVETGINSINNSNITVPPLALVDSDNNATAATITCTLGTSNNRGTTVPSGRAFAGLGDELTDSYVFTSVGNELTATNYVLENMPDGTYDYRLIGSSGSSPPRVSWYSWDGGATDQELECSGNTTNEAIGSISIVGGAVTLNWGRTLPNQGNAYLNYLELEFVSGLGPTIIGPSTQAGDNAALSIITSQASITAPVSIEFSKDGFVSVLGEMFPDITSQTDVETVIDFKAGFEQTLIDGIARECIPHTRNGVSCRWKLFEDDDITPMYLEFTHNPKAGFVAQVIVKSQYVAGNSLLDVGFQYLGEQDQHYMPEVINGGTPDPLNADYGDIDHPQPNYMGGDSETFIGSVVSVMYFEQDLKTHRLTTPITQST